MSRVQHPRRFIPAVLDCGCRVRLDAKQAAERKAGRRVRLGCGKHRRVSRVVRMLTDATRGDKR